MKANGYYNHPRVPLEAGCGLIEEDSIAFTSVSGKTAETPSFPLEIFPKAIRDIIELLRSMRTIMLISQRLHSLRYSRLLWATHGQSAS